MTPSGLLTRVLLLLGVGSLSAPLWEDVLSIVGAVLPYTGRLPSAGTTHVPELLLQGTLIQGLCEAPAMGREATEDA